MAFCTRSSVSGRSLRRCQCTGDCCRGNAGEEGDLLDIHHIGSDVIFSLEYRPSAVHCNDW
jgi:hypothetical protein